MGICTRQNNAVVLHIYCDVIKGRSKQMMENFSHTYRREMQSDIANIVYYRKVS